MINKLRNIPFFAHLDDAALDAISKRLRREHYHKGAAVFLENEPGDCMYIIESGQIKIVSERDNQEKIFGYLGPGTFFGERSALFGERRSATARVVIDADLLVLRKDDLNELLQAHPQIALMMIHELERRLSRSNLEPTVRDEYNITAVLSTSTPTLARYLAQVTGEEVFILDLGGLAHSSFDQAALRHVGVLLARGEDILGPEMLAERLSQLVERFYWVLLAIAPYETPLTLKAIELADVTVQIGDRELPWLKTVPAKAFWRINESKREIQRLARRISQRLVGLALSSGNARGIAHIGVLKVLEQEGIPIDMISATSAGAVFGAMYAAGRSIAELIEIAANIQRQFNVLTGFQYWDFRFPPISGIMRGNRVLDYLRKCVYDKTFEELLIPLLIIAADLFSGEEIVFEQGSVAEAVRASMSVIGMFEPARVAGRFLIDGGSVNPVPTQLLADRGVSIILASNVIPGLEDRLHRQALKREGKMPNLIGILTGAMEIMESEIIKSRMGPVDILIQPKVAQYSTTEYDKVYEIIKRGEEATAALIPAIRERIAPRPRPPRMK